MSSKIVLVFLIFSGVFLQPVLSQSAPFAYLVDLTHDCDGSGGSAEFQLNGKPGEYDYYWKHGPRDLRLTGLAPGIYIFRVVDRFGCLQEFEIEILGSGTCSLDYTVSPTSRACFYDIHLDFFVGTGIDPAAESGLEIQWADGYTGGLDRRVNLAGGLTYCVTVSLASAAGPCCSQNVCITIESEAICSEGEKYPLEPLIIVNEYHKGQDGQGQFVELLVVGDGACEETMDIRGFSIDDNNGELIPAGGFVFAFNQGEIGINPGYISFSNHEVWDSVPHGSLIVIFDEHQVNPAIPALDPTDANQDGVYVLAANDTIYLTGRSGRWEAQSKTQEYGGTPRPPAWALIELSSPADGIQVRKPTGSWSHGISQGASQFSAENTYPLWITDQTLDEHNCRLVLLDYMDKTHFDCTTWEQGLLSPGLANSAENALIIQTLMVCPVGSQSPLLLQVHQEPLRENTIAIYPNPFQDQLVVEYFSMAEGQVNLELFDISGKRVFNHAWHSSAGPSRVEVALSSSLSQGAYVARVHLPDGFVESEGLIRILEK